MTLENWTSAGRKAQGITWHDVRPFNVSFDRLVPGIGYNDVANVCATCWSYALQSGFALSDFMVLLGKLAVEGITKRDANGFLCGAPPPRSPKLNRADKRLGTRHNEGPLASAWLSQARRFGPPEAVREGREGVST